MAEKKNQSAKQTQMSAEAEEERRAQLAERTYIAEDPDWDSVEGDEFGGQADILILEVGEASKNLTYVGHQQMTTNLGETTVHLATNENGDTLRCPIQATFQRAVDQAGLTRGDVFRTKRFDDTLKKGGKGAGKPMAIYAIKVITRAVRAPVAA